MGKIMKRAAFNYLMSINRKAAYFCGNGKNLKCPTQLRKNQNV